MKKPKAVPPQVKGEPTPSAFRQLLRPSRGQVAIFVGFWTYAVLKSPDKMGLR
jgi:hypothetical protein